MKYLIKFICITLCLTSIVFATSCKKTDKNNEPSVKVEQWDEELLNNDRNDVGYTYYFKSVEEMISAIKHNPDKYNKARVKVIGTIYKSSEETLLVDYTMRSDNIPSFSTSAEGSMNRYYFRQSLKTSDGRVDIVIINDAQYSVAEIGDLVKMYGTVNITRDSIFISGEYALIATLEERIQNINNQD